MLCKICNAIMYIKHGRYRAEGDSSGTEVTKLFYDQTLECTDKKCKHTEIISNEIQLGGE